MDIEELRRLEHEAFLVSCNPPSGECSCHICRMLKVVPALLDIVDAAEPHRHSYGGGGLDDALTRLEEA